MEELRTADEIEFLQQIYQLLQEESVIQECEQYPVVTFETPEALKKNIDFTLGDAVQSTKGLLELCRMIVRYSVKTRHPHFRNQLYGGVDIFGLGASWISEALNTNQHTFEVAPAFTMCECVVLERVRKLFGYDTGDGVFTPGGSLANMYALVMARFRRFPHVKSQGLHNIPVLVCFTSDEAHYSIQKGMHWLGFGINHLVKVRTDAMGRMQAHDLEMAIRECLRSGKTPLLVNATVGTTVLGAIDPLREIAAVCQQYQLWMHVDACLGGTLMLSETHRRKLSGIELSDSIAWNPHKMLGAPLQCSLFITRHPQLLLECNSAEATYLFQQDKHYDVSFDTGDKSIQCGRKVDAFKLWVMWKARGDKGLAYLVDNALKNASYFHTKLQTTQGFRLVIPQFETVCVCFWYIPTRMRQMSEDAAWWEDLYKVAPRIKEKMMREGTLMIGYMPAKNVGNFFRFVATCHPVTTSTHLDRIIEIIAEYGEQV